MHQHDADLIVRKLNEIEAAEGQQLGRRTSGCWLS